jgi:hypothetical protein
MAWLYIAVLAVTCGLFLRMTVRKAARSGLGHAAAFLEPGSYVTLHWFALFVLEALLVLLDAENSQFRLAQLRVEARTHAVELAVLLGLIGYLAFVAGYLLVPRGVASRLPYLSSNAASPAARRAVVFVWMSLGLLALAQFGFARVAELFFFSVSRTATTGHGYLFAIVQGWSIGLIISYAYRRRRGPVSLAVTGLYVMAVTPMMAFGRTKFLFVVLAFIVIAAYSPRPPKTRSLMVVAASLLAMATFLLVARKHVGGYDQAELVAQGSVRGIAAARHTFVSFDSFANYLTVRDAPYWAKFGPEYLFGFVFYALPGRSMNPYELTIPETLMRYVYQSDGGAPPTILGIGAVALGPVGAMVLMAVGGMLSKLFSEYVLTRRGEISVVMMLAVFDSRIHVVLWGSYESGMLQLVIAFGWLLLALAILSRRRSGRSGGEVALRTSRRLRTD